MSTEKRDINGREFTDAEAQQLFDTLREPLFSKFGQMRLMITLHTGSRFVAFGNCDHQLAAELYVQGLKQTIEADPMAALHAFIALENMKAEMLGAAVPDMEKH